MSPLELTVKRSGAAVGVGAGVGVGVAEGAEVGVGVDGAVLAAPQAVRANVSATAKSEMGLFNATSSERHSGNMDMIYSRGVGEKAQVPLVNIANALTVLRLVLVPVFIWVFSDPTPQRSWLAWAVFALAAFTDKLDGHLARSRGLITNFGKLADSIADKFLIISALVMLSAHGILWWWVTIVFIVREVGITVMRMVVVKKKVMAAGRGGKIKMMAQSIGAGMLIIPWHSFLASGPATAVMWLAYALIAVALVFALTSAADYIREARRIVHD